MAFYLSILPWYDQIFPFSPVQRDFVLARGADPALSIADVGCGTGSLIVSLAQVFRTTAGLDPDESMLTLARHKAAQAGAGTWFLPAGMLNLTDEFTAGSVDRLICFGNTLPHLANQDEVREFLRQARQVLSRNGLLLLQIINYDRILDQGLPGLPTIETGEFRFEREYLYEGKSPTHVRFCTKLTVHENGLVIGNEVPLLAIRGSELIKHLQAAGFSDVSSFGSFNGGPLTPESQPLILTAKS
jgi:ubiquinone/menaquinone biosynthesis C-methylase UbiE